MPLICNTIGKLFALPNKCLSVGLNITQVRTKVRYHLPYPTEVKRVRKQGYLKLLKTVNGRRQLMERILKGEKVIAQ